MIKSLRTLLCLATLLGGLSVASQGQSLVTGSLPASFVCPPGTLSIPFSVTGPFGTGNTFTAQLSDASGTFPTTPTAIGSITANPASATTLTITGTIPATTAISAVYKVRVISSAGSKASVSPTILAIGTAPPSAPATSPSFCQNTSPASVSATGQNLKWYANLTTTTVLGTGATLPVSTTATGPFSVYVTQTVNSCESARTQVTYTINALPSAPGVTSLSICEGQSVGSLNASFASGATPNWYGTNATGGTASPVAPSPSATKSDTYYVSQSVGGCESPRAGLSVTVLEAPDAPTVVTPSPYCPGDTPASLSATGQNLRWYGTNASGGTSTTTQLPSTAQPGTQTYYVSQTIKGCESPRASVSVVVKSRPSAPAVTTTPYLYCVGQAANPLTATPVNGGATIWYGTAATGGTASTTAPVPPTTSPGTTIYYASQTVNGCESPRASLTVVVSAIPSAPVPVTPPDYCQGSAATALTASGQNLQWYTSATGVSSTTSVVPGTSTVGSTSYYVSQMVNGCESTRATVTVKVKDAPDAPTVSAVSFCQNTTAPILSATGITGATFNWYTSPTGSASSTAPIPASGVAGNQTYYVSQLLNGCESPKTSLSVVVKSTPAAPGVSPLIVCVGVAASPLTASTVANASLNWYTTPTGGTAASTAPVPPTTTAGSTNFYVSQTLNGCEGPRTLLAVTVNAIPVAPTVASAGPYCQGSVTAPLSATGQALKWYGVNATGGTATTSQTPDNNLVGVSNYFVSQTVNGCESPRGSVAVQIKPTPGIPSTTPVEFCQNTSSPTLTAIPTTNATLNWYGTSANGPVSTTAPTPPNNTATTLTYYVSQVLDGCEGAKTTLAVRVKPTPGPPGTAPVAFCNNATSQPLTANGQNLTWYDQNDNVIANAPAPNTGSVGNQVYKVTQTQDGCISAKATLAVTINALPVAPGTSNLQYCLPTTDQPTQPVSALTAAGQNLKWYNPDGNMYNQTPTPPISQTGVITYQVTQTVNNCEGPKATLQVSIQTTPAPVIPKPLVTYCRNDVASPLEATGNNLRWIDPNNTLLPASTIPIPPTLNATPSGGVIYQVYQTGSNGCVSPRASIKVVVNTNPTLSILSGGLINLGQTLPLQLRFTGAPPFSYTISNGISGTALSDTASVAVTPSQTTIYQVSNVANVCGNGLPGDPASALVTVKIPTITTGNLNSSTLCAGSAFTIPYTTQGDFNLSLGYQAQLVSVTDTSGRNPINLNTTGTTLNPISLPIPANTPAGTYFVRVVRTVSTNPLIQVIGSNSPTRLTVRALPTASLSGTQNLYEGSPTTLTVTFGGDGPWSFTYMDSVRTFTASTTANPFLVSVQPLKTTTYRLTSVSNNCGTGVVSGTAVVTVMPLLGVEENALSDVVKVYPTPTISTLTVDIDRPLYTESALLELIDLRGQTTLQRTTRSKQTDLDLSTQPSGLYILKVTIGDKQTTRKILKQ